MEQLYAAAEMATLPFAWADAPLAQLSTAVAFPADQLKALLCLAAAYPVAAASRLLPTAGLKHALNVVVGVMMAQFVYGPQWVLSLVSATATYLLLRLWPSPAVVFVANMAFLAGLHLYRMHVDYMGWTMDASTSQMLLLIKLTSFAYNLHDGTRGAAAAQLSPTDSPQLASVKRTRRALAIAEFPSLLEYFGYVYCFPTFLAGPAFEFQEYMDAVTGARLVASGKVTRKPSPVRAALTKLTLALGFIAVLGTCGHLSDVRAAMANADSEPLTTTAARVYLALLLTRVKYYTAWKLAEGATVLSGAGFEGFDHDGEPKGWNGVSNVDVLGFELAENIRDLTRAWNKGTQQWLERYVYSRTGGSLLATYACSAIWHGFYPGYYLFFGAVPLATAVNRLARRHLRPYVVDSPLKPLYDVAGVVATALAVNYLATSFVVLSWTDAIAGFRAMSYAGHVGLIVAFVLFAIVPVRKLSAKKL